MSLCSFVESGFYFEKEMIKLHKYLTLLDYELLFSVKGFILFGIP